jgi:hypothetical protein
LHGFQACAFTTLKCNVFLMVQITLGLGVDADGSVTNLYTGPDASAAKDAVDAAGTKGTILEGYVYRNPPPVITLRYGPGLPGTAAGGS